MNKLIPTLSLLAIAPFAMVACSEQGSSETATETTNTESTEIDHSGHDHAQPQSNAGEVSPPAAPTSGEVFEVAGFAFTAPKGWMPRPPSNQMRLAELHVPGPTADDAQTCTAVFSTAGGDVEANINRWIGQFTNPAGGPVPSSRETRTVSGHTAHLVEMSGKYLGMGMAPPAGGTMMRAAIIEQPGPMNLFIKMTGPKDRMQQLTDDWNALIDSINTP